MKFKWLSTFYDVCCVASIPLAQMTYHVQGQTPQFCNQTTVIDRLSVQCNYPGEHGTVDMLDRLKAVI